MRTYVGFVDPADGRPTVLIEDGTEAPSTSELVALLDEIAEVATLRQADGPHMHAERLHLVLQRKHALVDRVVASEANGRPLPSVATHSAEGFAWGFSGDGPADLAQAILHRELAGADVPAGLYLTFRDDVVAALPAEGFRLPATEVWDWIRAHRDVVDRDVLGVETEEPSLAVVEADPDSPEAHAPETTELSGPSASRLVEACERAWADIRSHHPELPDVVIVLGTGVERGRLVKLGHWWGGRWIADGQPRGEVLLAGEALHLEPKQVFEVLLHEAAHGLNAARGVKDTSRGGRYHNERFAATAGEVGLDVHRMPPYGMARTELAVATGRTYADAIDRLGDTMRIARQLQGTKEVGVGGGQEGGDPTGEQDRERSRNAPSASCGCGRKMRMHPSTLAKGPVVCGVCRSEFVVGAQIRRASAEPEAPPPTTVDETFQARRRAELQAERDAELRERLERDQHRLESALDDPSARLDGSAPPLERRLERLGTAIEQLRGSSEGPPVTHYEPSAERRLDDWYLAFGTVNEQPIAALDPDEADELTRRARTILRRDGVLRGADLDLGPLDISVGDRLVVITAIDAMPPIGTPGDVVSVDHGRHVCTVDFATWGTLDVQADSERAAGLCHDYAVVAPARTNDPELALELERQRSRTVEPGP